MVISSLRVGGDQERYYYICIDFAPAIVLKLADGPESSYFWVTTNIKQYEYIGGADVFPTTVLDVMALKPHYVDYGFLPHLNHYLNESRAMIWA